METKDRGADRASPTGERPVAMPGSRLVTPRVSAEQTGGAYSLFEVEVEPGGGEGPQVQHREDECLYVVAGRFGFAVEGVETEAGPGTHLYVPKGALHAYTNNGAGTGRLLAVHTPGGCTNTSWRPRVRPRPARRSSPPWPRSTAWRYSKRQNR